MGWPLSDGVLVGTRGPMRKFGLRPEKKKHGHVTQIVVASSLKPFNRTPMIRFRACGKSIKLTGKASHVEAWMGLLIECQDFGSWEYPN